MPADKIITNHKGETCTFSEADHRYILGTRKDNPYSDLISCTTLVGQFKPPFDKNKVATAYAAKNNTTKSEVLAKWEADGAAACRFGTRIHETCEDALTGNTPRNKPESDREKAFMKAAWQKSKSVLNDFAKEILGIEMLLFSSYLRVAGTLDLLVRDHTGTIWILDWKTNADLRKAAFNGQTLSAPLSNIPCDSMSIYALQLSLYQFILVSEGYISEKQIVNRALIHFHQSADGAVSSELIPTPFYGFEAGLILSRIPETAWAKEREKQLPF